MLVSRKLRGTGASRALVLQSNSNRGVISQLARIPQTPANHLSVQVTTLTFTFTSGAYIITPPQPSVLASQ